MTLFKFVIKIIFIFDCLFFTASLYAADVNQTIDLNKQESLVSEEQLFKQRQVIDRLEKLIDEEHLKNPQRPKRIFVGARIKEYVLALYVEKWRQRVEWAGNLNYPKKAKEQKVYGTVRATVSVKANGELENVEINSSSGYKILDDAVIEIVKIAAPYAAFSEELKKKVDILSITRTWTFTTESMGVGQNWFLEEVGTDDGN